MDKACPRNGLVQQLTDEAVDRARRESYNLKPAEFGTRVHTILKESIKNFDDPNLVSERSAIKSKDADYGSRKPVRVDVLENVGDGSVCVYDIKTGKRVLSVPRMQEIANNVHSLYPGTSRILVIEKRAE